MKRILKSGWSISQQEGTGGLAGVAAPARLPSGRGVKRHAGGQDLQGSLVGVAGPA